jgi:pimeloyl-ACP methyl ester carboxylesterase
MAGQNNTPYSRCCMFRKIFVGFVIVYFAVGCVLFLFQELILFPVLLVQLTGKTLVASPPPEVRVETVTTKDGATLEGWTTYSQERFPNPKYVALIFHGNGETIHLGNFLPFFTRQGVPAFSFDYRGYGNSEGWPSEEKLTNDAEEIWASIKAVTGINDTQLIILGNSVGTGIATSLAKKLHTRAVFLIAPYASLTQIIKEHPIYSLFSWALRYHLPVARDLEAVASDYLVVAHGEQDEVIPFRHMDMVLTGAQRGEIRKIIPLISSTASHNNIYYSVEEKLTTALKEVISGQTTES